jgi:hypothetical protein
MFFTRTLIWGSLPPKGVPLFFFVLGLLLFQLNNLFGQLHDRVGLIGHQFCQLLDILYQLIHTGVSFRFLVCGACSTSLAASATSGILLLGIV